jgi:hypothetical protein
MCPLRPGEVGVSGSMSVMICHPDEVSYPKDPRVHGPSDVPVDANPADQWRLPNVAPPLPIQPPPSPGRSLRLLAVFAQLALAGTILVTVLTVPALWHQRSLIQDAVAGRGSVTINDVEAADNAAQHWSNAGLIALVLTGVVFIVWFYRARRNAEGFNDDVQRRGPGWAIGAWFVPIFNLWAPYQIATDTLLASDLPLGSRAWQRHSYAVLQAWWGCWLLSVFGDRIVALHDTSTPSAFESYVVLEVVVCVLQVIAAMLAILVVGRITVSNDRMRDSLIRNAGAPRLAQ